MGNIMLKGKVVCFIVFCFSATLYSQEPMFKATFESKSTSADIGTAGLQDDVPGAFTVVSNPDPDDVNSSNYVLKIAVPPSTKVRAEYANSARTRYPTEGETHIYTWKRYFPTDFSEGADINWLLISQWKTYPCEEYSDTYADYICDRGGIFNEIDLNDGETEDWRFRAEPDCNMVSSALIKGEWVKYVMEIYWTNGSDGYYKVYKNGNLMTEVYNVKTLMDFFQPGTCDIYFTLGLYTRWSSTSATKDSLINYIDDFYVYNKSSGMTLAGVCPECEGVEDVSGSASSCDDFAVTEEIINSDYGADNGSVNLTISGGTEPYTVLWSDGNTDEDRSELPPGTYTVELTDDNNCSLSETYIVLEEDQTEAGPMFKATFESNSTAADIGKELMQGNNGSTFTVVPNPSVDNVNTSNSVLKIAMPSGTGVRAEYSNSASYRYPTEGETHIYSWKKYFPADFSEGADINWLLIAQWKTYPCEEYGDYGDVICGGGGIFNEIDLNDGETEEWRFRAEPDCNTVSSALVKGEWVKYDMEIYWSNASDGYYKVYKNGNLVTEVYNVKTLFDNFITGTCDIFFALGLYSSWSGSSSSKDSLICYIDDFYVYDTSSGMTFSGVCPECGEEKEDPCSNFNVYGRVINSDYDYDDGSITLKVVGGTEPYSFKWGDNVTTKDRVDLSEGSYTVSVIDSNDCEFDSTFELLRNALAFKRVEFYPNPTTGLVAVKYQSPSAEEVQVYVKNAADELVINKVVNANVGDNKQVIDLRVDDEGNDLASGTYEVVFYVNDDMKFYFRVVKRD